MAEAQRQIINGAIGRIFLLGSRPEQPSDVATYERCRKVILDLLDPDNAIRDRIYLMEHNAARDHRRGAAGD